MDYDLVVITCDYIEKGQDIMIVCGFQVDIPRIRNQIINESKRHPKLLIAEYTRDRIYTSLKRHPLLFWCKPIPTGSVIFISETFPDQSRGYHVNHVFWDEHIKRNPEIVQMIQACEL